MSAKPTQKTPVTKPAAAKVAEPVKAAPKASAKAEAAPKAEKAAAPAKVEKAAAPKKPAATPAPAKEAKEATDESHGRIQLANVLHINISQARCATHLKQHLGDDAIENQVKALRASYKTAQEKNDNAAMNTLRDQIAAAGKSLVRISSETPIAVAVVWDCAVKELLRRGMDRAIAADRKIVDIAHLHEGDSASTMSLSPLYVKCPLWANFNAEHEAALKKAGAKEAEPEAEAPEGEVAEASKNSFYTYVENA